MEHFFSLCFLTEHGLFPVTFAPAWSTAQPVSFYFKTSWNSVTPVLGAEVVTHACVVVVVGFWLLGRVSLVFVVNNSVPSFTAAAGLIMSCVC